MFSSMHERFSLPGLVAAPGLLAGIGQLAGAMTAAFLLLLLAGCQDHQATDHARGGDALGELRPSTRPKGSIEGRWVFQSYEWIDETGWVAEHRDTIRTDIQRKRGKLFMHFQKDGSFRARHANPLQDSSAVVRGSYEYLPDQKLLKMHDEMGNPSARWTVKRLSDEALLIAFGPPGQNQRIYTYVPEGSLPDSTQAPAPPAGGR